MADARRAPQAALVLALAAAALGGCGSERKSSGTAETVAAPSEPAAAAEAERITIPGAGEALVWGEGRDAILLAHGAIFDAASWGPQARRIAAQGNLVVALEGIAPEQISAALEYLGSERSAASVTLIGASAGADAALQALAMRPGAADQLVTLSVNSAPSGQDLGPEPKLFIASEGEPGAALSAELAQSSSGADNQALLLAGSAHAQAIFDGEQGDRALQAILKRLRQAS